MTWFVSSLAVGVVLQGPRPCRADAVPAPVHDPFPQWSGEQVEEGGFTTQDDAIERLTQIYAEKTAVRLPATRMYVRWTPS
ncbi:hypothetical protein [Streptomyces sp. NPDC001599]|uniref:hypothetical protein n=1 Tax=Streptomyces sp. NPDC001599 TaxID=3364591 RepID=UPI00368989C2